jgi:hypothetical protein
MVIVCTVKQVFISPILNPTQATQSHLANNVGQAIMLERYLSMKTLKLFLAYLTNPVLSVDPNLAIRRVMTYSGGELTIIKLIQ